MNNESCLTIRTNFMVLVSLTDTIHNFIGTQPFAAQQVNRDNRLHRAR